jgi:glucokinase
MLEGTNLPFNENSLIIGVDVGGTKIAAGVVDQAGNIYGRIKIPTALGDAEMTLNSIAEAIQATLDRAGLIASAIKGIGLGIPGKIDPVKGIGVYSSNLAWQNIPVKSWLENRFNLPCQVENDVGAGAMGESRYGAGRGLANFVYVSIGTGVAARFINEGRLFRGMHGLAGEIGHVIIVPGGPLCPCGGHGCLEAVVSGRAIGLLGQAGLEADPTSLLNTLLTSSSASRVTSEMVFEAARLGDELANRILAKAGLDLAYGLHQLALIYDPQAIILGGGLTHQKGPFLEAIWAGLAYWSEQAPLFKEINGPNFIKLSQLNQDGAILGAAAIFQG